MASFHARAVQALGDANLRRNFRRAMDGLMAKRKAQFADDAQWRALRSQGAAVKGRVLAELPRLLQQFEANCRKNGIQVHWAETIDDANRIVLGLFQERGVKRLIKGKSMVSEEMHLNRFLEANGIQAVESDLGEYVIQLAGEAPSHIIMPCIHKNRDQIAALFADKIAGQPYTEDVAELTEAARRVLRAQFGAADAGLSGVNFGVAETGTLVLVENEGNGRLSTTLPPLHVAVMGIEKLVPTLDDIPPLLALLTRSATGQPITTYVNMITSPRKDGELDGPQEVHLVLLDNGRSRIYGDVELRETLRCIRCGACMNHCPVYGRVGGHAYDAVYPGPIGQILTPQIEGIAKAGELPHACTLCNACVEICPVEVPLAQLMVRMRREAVRPGPAVKDAGAMRSTAENWSWRAWQWLYAHPALYRLAARLLARFGNLAPASAPLLKEWTSVREKPVFAGKTLHELAREKGFSP